MIDERRLVAVLSEFAHTLLTDFPIQGILDHLVDRIVGVLPVSAAGVTLITPGAAPRYVAASDAAALRYEQLQTDLREGPCALAYASGDPVSVPDLTVDERFPAFAAAARDAGLAAVFTFPLRHDAGRLGALDLYRETPGPLDDADVAAAQTLADVTAAYLLNAETRDEARRVADHFRTSALHDSLTGLPNRRLLQERIEHAGSRARRSHSTAAVLYADLDRFKQVNDTFGHAMGDTLLTAVARRLRSLIRPGDTLARLSGDEFVILCEDLTCPDDAEVLAARVTGALAEPFELMGEQVTIGASVGIAYAGPGESVTPDLITAADLAMYEAKRRGGAGHRVGDLA